MKIITEYDPKPIPDRRFDWVAYDSDTYDADYDDERGFYSNSPCGYGRTEQEAIEDFWIEWELRK